MDIFDDEMSLLSSECSCYSFESTCSCAGGVLDDELSAQGSEDDNEGGRRTEEEFETDEFDDSLHVPVDDFEVITDAYQCDLQANLINPTNRRNVYSVRSMYGQTTLWNADGEVFALLQLGGDPNNSSTLDLDGSIPTNIVDGTANAIASMTQVVGPFQYLDCFINGTDPVYEIIMDVDISGNISPAISSNGSFWGAFYNPPTQFLKPSPIFPGLGGTGSFLNLYPDKFGGAQAQNPGVFASRTSLQEGRQILRIRRQDPSQPLVVDANYFRLATRGIQYYGINFTRQPCDPNVLVEPNVGQKFGEDDLNTASEYKTISPFFSYPSFEVGDNGVFSRPRHNYVFNSTNENGRVAGLYESSNPQNNRFEFSRAYMYYARPNVPEESRVFKARFRIVSPIVGNYNVIGEYGTNPNVAVVNSAGNASQEHELLFNYVGPTYALSPLEAHPGRLEQRVEFTVETDDPQAFGDIEIEWLNYQSIVRCLSRGNVIEIGFDNNDLSNGDRYSRSLPNERVDVAPQLLIPRGEVSAQEIFWFQNQDPLNIGNTGNVNPRNSFSTMICFGQMLARNSEGDEYDVDDYSRVTILCVENGSLRAFKPGSGYGYVLRALNYINNR